MHTLTNWDSKMDKTLRLIAHFTWSQRPEYQYSITLKKEIIIAHENMNPNEFCVSVSLWPHQLPLLQPTDEPGDHRSKPASVVNLEFFESCNLDIFEFWRHPLTQTLPAVTFQQCQQTF